MEVKRLFDLFPYQQEKFPQKVSVGGKLKGQWATYSTQEVIEMTDSLATGLMNLGMKKGDAIAIMSINSVHWVFADLAIQKMGGIVIPIYPTSAEKDLAFVLNHSETRLIFIQDPVHLEKLNNVRGQTPSLQHIYAFTEIPGVKKYEELIVPPTPADLGKLKSIQDAVGENDLATIIYTSGTTGDPKGVMLSHANIITNLKPSTDRLPVGKDHDALSFLPLSHIFERMICYMYYYNGLSVYFAESMDTIGDNLKEIRPHVFTAVPRLLEKVYDRIIAGGSSNTGLKLKLFNWCVKLALQWEPDGANGAFYNMKLRLADKLVASKIRAKAGIDRVIAVASGSAALQPRLARFYNGIGVPLVEGYGLTETSPVITVNCFEPGRMKIGAVGPLLDFPGYELKIADDGEILFKGPNLMLGYYKREDLTREAIDTEGWFHTGDIGDIDKKGFLRITDRKKEMFKTSGGKYIAPQVLENKLKASLFVEQVCVVGEYRKFPGCLLVPNFEVVRKYLSSIGIKPSDKNEDIILQPEVINKIQVEVDKINGELAQYEKIKKFVLLSREFTIDAGEITPKLSLRRKAIDQRYKAQIEHMYASEGE